MLLKYLLVPVESENASQKLQLEDTFSIVFFRIKIRGRTGDGYSMTLGQFEYRNETMWCKVASGHLNT